MKGVSFVTNSKNQRVAVQIDLKTFAKHQMELEEFLEGIITEYRNNEKRIPLSIVISKLKRKGKIK